MIPSVEAIGAKFAERRRGQGPADRLVRKLFGLDMKAQAVRRRCGVRAGGGRAGRDGAFNRIWTSPNTLPTKAEIAKPELWMTRVLRATGGGADPRAGYFD